MKLTDLNIPDYKMHNYSYEEVYNNIMDNYDAFIMLLRETVNTYTSSNRATIGGSCCYLTDDGKMCAVGRCLNEKGLAAFSAYEAVHGGFGVCSIPSSISLSDSLQDEYKNISIVVWDRIQSLHDDDDRWCDEGISDEGREYIKKTFGPTVFYDVFENEVYNLN